MNRWLVLSMLLVLPLAGCTGKDDGDTDPTPTPAASTPTPSPTRATPTPASTPPPTATPSSTPASTPTPTGPPPTPTPPGPSSKNVDFSFDLVAGDAPSAPIPGLPTGGGGNCAGFAAGVVLGGNATATYEASAIPGGPEVELILLGPDGAVLARAPGPSPVLTIPPSAQGASGIKFVVQYVEEPPLPQTTDVTVSGVLIIPADATSPAQDAPAACDRVESAE